MNIAAPHRTLPIVSGGLDSVTLAYWLRNRGREVPAILSFNYGQRHRVELDYARSLARDFDVDHVVLNIEVILGQADSALTSRKVDVPDGHYAEESMKATIVPGRNMLMIAAAIPIAARYGCDQVAVGVHGGDHFIYPDCRPDFVASVSVATRAAYDVDVIAPFLSNDKAFIAQQADMLGVPIRKTWSCYKGGSLHCGTCGTCVERREAFALAHVDDPTEYKSLAPLPAAPKGA